MKFFKKRQPKPSGFIGALAPDVPFYAIGDIHGSDLLLERLIQKLANLAHPEARLVCVGDFVDRGEQSAQVLHRLFEMQNNAGDLMVCLMGNHEHMMLKFLDEPVSHGARWLRYGGLQTLASFQVAGLPGSSATELEWIALRDRFREALGPELENWVRNLPSHWKTGNVSVVHAGADPSMPIEGQDRATLLWGHPDFFKVPRKDGEWVVHGHTIVDVAQAKDGRIAVDTGAYATGKLTAALVERSRVSLIVG